MNEREKFPYDIEKDKKSLIERVQHLGLKDLAKLTRDIHIEGEEKAESDDEKRELLVRVLTDTINNFPNPAEVQALERRLTNIDDIE